MIHVKLIERIMDNDIHMTRISPMNRFGKKVLQGAGALV